MFWLFLWTILWAAILFVVGALVGELARRMADERGLTAEPAERDAAPEKAIASTTDRTSTTMAQPSPAARPIEREPVHRPVSQEVETKPEAARTPAAAGLTADRDPDAVAVRPDPIRAEKPLMTPTVDEPAVSIAGADDEEAPERLSAPRNGTPDDLTRIRGIGKRNEERLHALGIYHYEQIADWKWEHQKWVESHLAFPGRIGREKWVDQARTLAGKGTTGATGAPSGVSLN